MRLYLAAAVLMLAFVASTEAQTDTIQERLSSFGQTLLDAGKKALESASTHYDRVKNSEVVNASGNWLHERLSGMKKTISDMFQ